MNAMRDAVLGPTFAVMYDLQCRVMHVTALLVEHLLKWCCCLAYQLTLILTTLAWRLLLQNCRNCLVASDPAAKYGACAKIADLGVSRALQQHKTHRTTQNLGTITHTAPELLRYGRMSPAR
jgi:hypothetical protein